MAGVLDEAYSQVTPLSGVAVQARQSTLSPSYVAWRAGIFRWAELSKVRLKLQLLLSGLRQEKKISLCTDEEEEEE